MTFIYAVTKRTLTEVKIIRILSENKSILKNIPVMKPQSEKIHSELSQSSKMELFAKIMTENG